MSLKEELSRRVKAWLMVKEFNVIPTQSPSANVPDFPDSYSVKLKKTPKITTSLERLGVASVLGYSIPVLASLVSLMKRADAANLYNKMSCLSVPETFDEEMAYQWFSVCHRLSEGMMAPAVSGFFKLLKLVESGNFPMDLSSSLACFYKVLMVSHIRDNSKVEVLIDVAEQFPDRFAYVCVRAVSGGDKVLSAASNFLFELNHLELSADESSSILDFTMETGWLLDERDYDQIFKLILQKGSLLQGRLSGGLVPMSSIRFFAGILRGIEETKGLDALLAKERISRAKVIFESDSSEEMEECFQAYPKLAPLVDHQIKLDLAVESISHKITERDQSDIGFSVISFLDNMPGGISLTKLFHFFKVSGEEISGETIDFLSKLVGRTEKRKRLSPANFIRFSGIVSILFPRSTPTDKASLKVFYRALTEMDNSSSRHAIIQLKKATSSSLVSLESIMLATSLLIRVSNKKNRDRYLLRIRETGRLLDALAPIDRQKLLSGVTPLWARPMFSASPEVEKMVIDYIGKVKNISDRKRYLEKVVSRLLQEALGDEPIFKDCLAFAVAGYNSSSAIEKLRETEHQVNKKIFRAGGRIEAVDRLIKDLLVIPGFEGDNIELLITGIRSICDRFSRLAIWAEGGDSIFSTFLSDGVGNILRAFVDNPGTLESVNGDVLVQLVSGLLPEAVDSTSASGIISQGTTAQIFLGSIIPDSISLFSREPLDLSKFLFEMSDEFSRSVGGMTAGEEFAQYIVRKLDMERQQDSVASIQAWLCQRTPPPFNLESNWPNRRRNEWNDYISVGDTTRLKLHTVIASLAGPHEIHSRDLLLKTVAFLSKRIAEARVRDVEGLSLQWDRAMVDDFLAVSGNVPPLLVFSRGKTGVDISPELYSYLEAMDGFIEQDVTHAWRLAALPPLLNCAIEVLLVSGNSLEVAEKLIDTATNAVEFLGYSNAVNFLSTLQETLRSATSSDGANALLEKKFLLPLWKRNSAARLDLLVLGMEDDKLLMEILNERLSMEETVGYKVWFMKNYATFFITVERAVLEIQSTFEKTQIAEGLMESWIFSGTGRQKHRPVKEIVETAELTQDIFRRVKYGRGIISASEAGEISADMRRKYRDNADSVAIILRWTVDPAREGLLQLLEESQLLLQAAGTDTELMNLLDTHGTRSDFLQEAKPYAEDPTALKKYLKEIPMLIERG